MLIGAVGVLLSPVQPAHAHDVCKVEGFTPNHDHLTTIVTAGGVVACSRVQQVVVLWATAQKQIENAFGELEWADRGTSKRSWNDSFGGYWEAEASCAQSETLWRTKLFATALERAGDTSFFRNDQDTGYSGPRWVDCYHEIPLIDPGSR